MALVKSSARSPPVVSPLPFTVLITTELVIYHAPRARSPKVVGTDLPPRVLR